MAQPEHQATPEARSPNSFSLAELAGQFLDWVKRNREPDIFDTYRPSWNDVANTVQRWLLTDSNHFTSKSG